MALEIKDLHVEVGGKEILKGLTLSVEEGKVTVLMGPNGSGKSTLAHVLVGHPKYKVTKGSITFNGKDITSLNPAERAQEGLFLSFQMPSEVEGVTITQFLRSAYNSLKKDSPLNVFGFKKYLLEKAKLIGEGESFISRYLNVGFSGGEKKKSEILQLLTLDPQLAILDETDSGLDIDSLRVLSGGINRFKSTSKNKTVLLITHYKRILHYIVPDKAVILKDGKIVKEGDSSLVDHLEEKGYSWIKE